MYVDAKIVGDFFSPFVPSNGSSAVSPFLPPPPANPRSNFTPRAPFFLPPTPPPSLFEKFSPNLHFYSTALTASTSPPSSLVESRDQADDDDASAVARDR